MSGGSERPILFSGAMVRAILEGRKWQTRRVIKPQPIFKDRVPGKLGAPGWSWKGPKIELNSWDESEFKRVLPKYSPYGQPGDRLWVRESFGVIYDTDNSGPDQSERRFFEETVFKADNPKTSDHFFDGWKPSIHMPRWASRITLEITGVRVQRLQDLTEEDAQAEGRTLQDFGATGGPGYFPHTWDDINEKRGFGWDTNPWVWVIEFRRERP